MYSIKNINFKDNKNIIYIIFLIFVTSGFVYIEPAPYDILLIFISFWYIMFFRTKSKQNLIIPLTFVWLFVCCNILSLFFASQFAWSLRYFLITLYLCISYIFLIAFVSDYKIIGLNAIFSGYTISAIITSIIGILSYFNILPFYRGVREGRLISTFKDANVMAPFIIVITIYSLNKILTGKRKFIIFWIITFIVTNFSVFLSFSRGAWLNLACSLAFYFFFIIIIGENYKRKYFKLVVLIFVCFIAFYSIYFIINRYEEIGKMTIYRITKPLSSETRFERQKYVLQVFFESPLGRGPGSSKFLNPAQHNVYLQVLYENGVFAFFCFLIFIIISLIKSIKQIFKYKYSENNIALIVASILFGLIINSMFIDSLHWRHMWLILAIPWGISNLNSNR